jgi:diaminohydroxyphosphoribosylaminopyrimidine deaminase/5-amino-6-(5-phosphoribosylamino)uracil reductase
MTDQIINTLFHKKIQSVLIEGGRQLLQSFIDADMWDEAQIEVANIAFGNGVSAPCLKAELFNTEQVGDSVLLNFRRTT